MRAFLRTAVFCLGFAGAGECLAGRALLISSNYTGLASANGSSDEFAVTPDGRHIVFRSSGRDLEANDTNSNYDLYLLDRMSGTRRCVTGGYQSYRQYRVEKPTITPDGRWVAFWSDHTNLVSGASNLNVLNLFVYDAANRTLSLAHASEPDHPQAPGIPALSADGRYLSFETFTPRLLIHRRDLTRGETETVSVDTNGVAAPVNLLVWRVTPDARYFAFATSETNIVSGMEKTNSMTQVYLRDMETRQTKLVSLTAGGGFCEAHAFVRALSRDGRYVAFKTASTNVVTGVQDGPGDDLFVRDMVSNTTWCVTMHTNGTTTAGGGQVVREASFSADAAKIIFLSAGLNLAPNLTAGNPHAAYTHDMIARTNWGVGLAGLAQGSGDGILELSDDGRFAIFLHQADLLACDTQTGRVRKVGRAPFIPLRIATRLSADGRAVFFVSGANEASGTEDGNGSSDVFVSPTMPLEVLGVSLTDPAARVQAAGLPGAAVRLQSSTNFDAWDDVGNGLLGLDGTAVIEDARQQTGRRFYRLISP